MNESWTCDYCAQPAAWQVTTCTGSDPTTGTNRYVCRAHVDPAREHLRQLRSAAGVNVLPFGQNREAA